MDEEGQIDLPKTQGTILEWIYREEEQDFFNRETCFLSSELYEKFGQYAFHSEEDPISIDSEIEGFHEVDNKAIQYLQKGDRVEIDTDIRQVLEKEDVPYSAADFLLSEQFQKQASSQGTLLVRISSGKLPVDTIRFFADFEKKIRSKNSNVTNNANRSSYSGPLFAYSNEKGKSQDDLDPDSLLELKSPINTGWKNNNSVSPQNIGNQMKNNGWSGFATKNPAVTGTRYIITNLSNGIGLQKQKDQAGKSKSVFPSHQWHIRFFDIPDVMDATFQVAGQAHRDPPHHNNPIQTHGWKFSQSRNEVKTDWQQLGAHSSTLYIGNKDGFSSSQGKQVQIDP
ncbi:hypothetical protein [Halovenus marina]|uniref:hypothetical protein n=1 Tax=Halovenus marina TaxID=3396621 RepID=UPI003F55E224